MAKHVHDHANEIRRKVISDLNSLKEKGYRFGIDTDEYTTIGNKKFATINVYCTEYNVCLGLIRARGSTPATKYKELIEERLESFELDTKKDLISATSDAASVMVLWGKLIPCLHVQCIVHAGHLAVVDCLYVKKSKASKASKASQASQKYEYESDSEASDSEDEDEEVEKRMLEDGSIEFSVVEKGKKSFKPELKGHWMEAVEETRKVSRFFRKSTGKNDFLQEGFVKPKHGRELNLILDVKTRWSSMKNMIQRFLFLAPEVEMAMLAQRKRWYFNEDILKNLKDLSDALQLIDDAMSRYVYGVEEYHKKVLSTIDNIFHGYFIMYQTFLQC